MQHKKPIEPTPKQNEMIEEAFALHHSGQLDLAEIQYKKLLIYLPTNVSLLTMFGTLALQKGRLEDAVKIIGESLQIDPNQTNALNNRGNALRDLKRLDEALESFDHAIALKPDFAEAHSNRGNTLLDHKRLDEALISYDRAIALKPNFADPYSNRGFILNELKRLDEALISLDRAITLNPNNANAHANRGVTLKFLKRLDEALVSFERANSLNPDMDFVLGELSYTKRSLFIWNNHQKHLNELINKINNGNIVSHPLQMLSLVDDSLIHRRTSEIYVKEKYPKRNIKTKINRNNRHERIRIGYFSGDFRNHPVSYLTAELYEIHDRNKFEVYAFSYGPDAKDEMHLRIQTGVDHFHDIREMSDKDAAILARSVEIDIAIDLGGFTRDSRTGIFAMSAAPIQLSYIGYLGTMGASYYDYLLADQTIIPENNKEYYSEKIVYLPSYQVNDSKKCIPDAIFTREDIGLPEEGFVFCCFNNTYKITPTTFDGWARILKQVEGSVLLLLEDNKTAKINLTRESVRKGIHPNRLIFGKRLPMTEYLARYRITDLFLDTLPYNAGTTASDALRMGLPVLSCIGNSFASRVGASLLNAVNLPELITTTQEQYESLAIQLALHPEKLKIIKDKLINNLPTAPLYDTPLFTRHLESAYLTMYDRYQHGLDPDHIYV